MKKAVLFLIMVVLLSGCGEVLNESSGGGGGSSPAAPAVRRLPIDRPFTISSGTIAFTDSITTAGITNIEYDAGRTPNIVVRIGSVYANKNVMICTVAGNISFTPTAGILPNNFGVWYGDVGASDLSSTVYCCYGVTRNVFEPADRDNYVELYVDSILVEKYWLSDFLINP